MDAKGFRTFTKTYEFDGKFYKATADFIAERLEIKYDHSCEVIALSEYENFEGNMEDFIKARYIDE